LEKYRNTKETGLQHINKMPRNTLPKRILKNDRPTGRRNQGRPLKILLDVRDRNESISDPTSS
jgi:hypothetical protein